MYDSLKITPKTRGYQIIFNHTNFHLYHYAGNNPVNYIDPDGRTFDLSEVTDPELKKLWDDAINELKRNSFAKGIIEKIEGDKNFVVKVRINSNSINKYLPETKELYWDPNRFLYKASKIDVSVESKNGKVIVKKETTYVDVIDSITLLFHEIGHAYQNFTGKMPSVKLSKEEEDRLENDCIAEYESKVIKDRHNYSRKDTYEGLFEGRTQK